jgi:hypothetical protein
VSVCGALALADRQLVVFVGSVGAHGREGKK